METLGSSDLPTLYQSADRASIEGQTRARRLTAAILALGILAALAGVLGVTAAGVRVSSWIAAGAFTVSLVLTYVALGVGADNDWYRGRALAESVKTLAWEYAVGGGPFCLSACPDADARLRDDFLELRTQLSIGALPVDTGPEISEQMRRLRQSSLPDRIHAYEQGRIEDQIKWYSGKVAANRRAQEGWRLATLSTQLLGVVFAVLYATGALEITLAPVMAALAAAAVAWVRLRDHATLAVSYSVAGHDLKAVAMALPAATVSETTWAEFVDAAELAISREHTVWLARRGVAPR